MPAPAKRLEEFHNGFFRFSVGIEDADDIIGDLKQALEKTGLPVL